MIYSRFEAYHRQHLRRVPIVSPTLMIVRQGEKRIYNGTHEIRLPVGRGIILPTGINPEIENKPINNHYWADVFTPPLAWLSRFQQQYGHLLIHQSIKYQAFNMDQALDQALQQCITPPTQSNAWHEAQQELAWHQVTLELIRLEVAANLFITTNTPLTQQLRELFNLAPSQSWEATQVAKQLEMSTATLRRRLQAENTSFSQLLQEARLAHALGLLVTSTLPINEIAGRCGYENVPAFSHAFKKHFGMSPSELRLTQQKSLNEQLA